MQKEISKHYVPKISLYDSCMLFFSTRFGKALKCCGKPIDLFCCTICFPKRKKLEKLYDATNERFEYETDIVKIMKDLRNVKVLLKNSLMNEEKRF